LIWSDNFGQRKKRRADDDRFLKVFHSCPKKLGILGKSPMLKKLGEFWKFYVARKQHSFM
jgi:hypothetical protein